MYIYIPLMKPYKTIRDAESLTISMVDSTPIAYKIVMWTSVICTIYVVTGCTALRYTRFCCRTALYVLWDSSQAGFRSSYTFITRPASSRHHLKEHGTGPRGWPATWEPWWFTGSLRHVSLPKDPAYIDSTQVSRSSSKQTAYRQGASPAVFSQ